MSEALDGCGVSLRPQANWTRTKRPLDVFTWVMDAAPYLTQDVALVSAYAAAAPHGTAELTLTGFDILGTTIALTLASGQPNRIYTVEMVLTGEGGVVSQLVLSVPVLPVLATDQPTTVPVPGFGPEIDWDYTLILDLTEGHDSVCLPLMW